MTKFLQHSDSNLILSENETQDNPFLCGRIEKLVQVRDIEPTVVSNNNSQLNKFQHRPTARTNFRLISQVIF